MIQERMDVGYKTVLMQERMVEGQEDREQMRDRRKYASHECAGQE